MIILLTTPRYDKERDKFVKNNIPQAKALAKTLVNFRTNPSHPSLNTEKLGGTDLWSIRVNKGNRIFFRWIDKKTALFMDIGKHDKYRKY